MKSIKPFLAISLLLTLSFIFSPAYASSKKIPVFVSILPQKYFVEKIGGKHVETSVMVEPGANPHNYEPKPMQMAKLASARIYFAIGVNFEDVWLKKIVSASDNIRIVHTEDGIEKLPMIAEDHDHGEDGHGNGSLDPHIWLSPKLVMIQAVRIKDALCDTDPSNKAEYEKRYASFIKEIKALDEELKAWFEKAAGRRFIVFHPSWAYFAKDYELEQIPVEIEGKQPKLAQLQKLIKTARNMNVRIIFAQPQFSAQSAEVVAREIGGTVVLVDPLAENWTENLKGVAVKFSEGLR